MLMICSGLGEVIEPTGTKFTVTGVSTSMETQSRLDMTFSRLNFSVGLQTSVSGFTHYFLGFPYNADNCVGRPLKGLVK
jgi:hypothetical protein